MKPLRIDNRIELCSIKSDQFCKNEGIVQHHTVLYTQQNGVTERMNMTLLERPRCMLSNVCQIAFGLRQLVQLAILVNWYPLQPLILRLLRRYDLVPLLITLSYEYLVDLLIFM